MAKRQSACLFALHGQWTCYFIDPYCFTSHVSLLLVLFSSLYDDSFLFHLSPIVYNLCLHLCFCLSRPLLLILTSHPPALRSPFRSPPESRDGAIVPVASRTLHQKAPHRRGVVLDRLDPYRPLRLAWPSTEEFLPRSTKGWCPVHRRSGPVRRIQRDARRLRQEPWPGEDQDYDVMDGGDANTCFRVIALLFCFRGAKLVQGRTHTHARTHAHKSHARARAHTHMQYTQAHRAVRCQF